MGGAGAASPHETWQVCILDWEWAGKAGEAFYPLTRNRRAKWPPGSVPGGAIEREHDRAAIVQASS